jgi:hypothetical protein
MKAKPSSAARAAAKSNQDSPDGRWVFTRMLRAGTTGAKIRQPMYTPPDDFPHMLSIKIGTAQTRQR